MTSLRVLCFGARAPQIVLSTLVEVKRSTGIDKVVLVRSETLQIALLQAPHRLFSAREAETAATKTGDVLVVCLPTSVPEYMCFQAEIADARQQVLTRNAIVGVFDPKSGGFLGLDKAHHLVNAVKVDGKIRSSLASAALQSFANLDLMSASQVGPSLRQDCVIVVGSGGREHALAVALAKSVLVERVICCPGNGGTASEGGKVSNAEGVDGKQDNATVIDLVARVKANMVVIGPEAVLVAGLVDELNIAFPDVKVFGPSKAAAELESSKAFTKDFLHSNGIPTATYRTFTKAADAISYVESLNENDRQVVKASGLAAGKGVLLPTTKTETIEAVKEIMSDKAFGSAGDTCVIESFLTGPEASCLAFCDGKTAVLLPPAQDHKRALDGDKGLNTGGMGAYAPAPCVTPSIQKEISAMCIKTVQNMAERGTPYVGILYAGMMLTPTGPKVLEFNCRFGDPEAQVLLPLLETDLYEVMEACCEGKLDRVDVRCKENASAVTVVCAAKGYPEKYNKGLQVNGIDLANSVDGVKVYHAGTKLIEGTARSSGGRILSVTGEGASISSALTAAYRGVKEISILSDVGHPEFHYRSDIAAKAVGKRLRIGVLGSTRGTSLLPVIEACQSGSLKAEVVAVLSNRESALILEKGRNLPANAISKFISSKGLTRAEYDAECSGYLTSAGVDMVLLVGYMRILSDSFTQYWGNKCINVHPSLLPKHAGGMDLAVHQAVIDAHEEVTGCTIHVVTEKVDGGPILVQRTVKVMADDTAESLKAKVQKLEGPAFIEAIKRFYLGGVIRYADAGVNIDTGNAFVDMIKPLCKGTMRPGCSADLGGFGGLFDLSAAGYNDNNTILIGTTDGVGTKLRIAQAIGRHEHIGIDLVAMCVNDLVVAGGEPLFFLDYFATGHLDPREAATIVAGIAEGCQEANCALIGGETAEMPSMYRDGEYDLAGFAVGATQRGSILPEGVSVGDLVVGLPSNGIHSNGFSLVRKLVEKEGLSYEDACPWDPSSSLGEILLTPTKIYVKACLSLTRKRLVKAMAHITGGGLLENLPRSLPANKGALISSLPELPPVFRWMQIKSGLDDKEMYRTFNCGVGMALIVNKHDMEEVEQVLKAAGEPIVFKMGEVVDGSGVSFVK